MNKLADRKETVILLHNKDQLEFIIRQINLLNHSYKLYSSEYSIIFFLFTSTVLFEFIEISEMIFI
jgi:hypothetical protein